MASIRSNGAGPSVLIDGRPLPHIAHPESASELAELLRECADDGRALIPIGGGTKLALGNTPARADLGVSTLALNAVRAYEPTDLTLSVEAGARWGEVQALLAAAGQTLPLDVSDPDEATLGGLVATAIAGPRRMGSGTLRDLLIGIEVAQPTGTVAKAGGMVVKNVSGFDMMRLHLGALGTLGVITAINLKVLPAARHEGTLCAHVASLDAGLTALRGIRAAGLDPIAADASQFEDGWTIAVRFEGRPTTVAARLDHVRRTLADAATVIDGSDSVAYWRGVMEEQRIEAGPRDALLRLQTAPGAVATLAREMIAALSRSPLSTAMIALSPANGQILLRVVGQSSDPASFLQLHQAMSAFPANLTVLAAPAEWKASIDVWGTTTETIDVMRALKSQFDPTGVLNRGRFLGRI